MSTSAIWSILRTYRPNAAKDQRTKNARKFGVFQATYLPPLAGLRGPRTDREAQALYNHIRTVAFWLDASPLLADLGLPFRVNFIAGLDDIISLVPLYGDIGSGILQLYQVWLSFLFGVPIQVIGWMLLNVILDVFVGVIPLLGDIIDNLFKSNLRNLALLETWLLTKPSAAKYHILLMPESDDFIPPHTKSWAGWFKGNKVDAAEQELRRMERVTGKVRRTRRMARDEADVLPSEPLD